MSFLAIVEIIFYIVFNYLSLCHYCGLTIYLLYTYNSEIDGMLSFEINVSG